MWVNFYQNEYSLNAIFKFHQNKYHCLKEFQWKQIEFLFPIKSCPVNFIPFWYDSTIHYNLPHDNQILSRFLVSSSIILGWQRSSFVFFHDFQTEKSEMTLLPTQYINLKRKNRTECRILDEIIIQRILNKIIIEINVALKLESRYTSWPCQASKLNLQISY